MDKLVRACKNVVCRLKAPKIQNFGSQLKRALSENAEIVGLLVGDSSSWRYLLTRYPYLFCHGFEIKALSVHLLKKCSGETTDHKFLHGG